MKFVARVRRENDSREERDITYPVTDRISHAAVSSVSMITANWRGTVPNLALAHESAVRT